MFQRTIVSLFLLPFVFAAPSIRSTPGRACGSNPTPEQVKEAEARFAALKANSTGRTNSPQSNGVPPSIPVYWHVINLGEDYSQGNVPDSQIADSMALLNQVYAPAGLTFGPATVTRTTNELWFTTMSDDTPEVNNAAKALLRQGDEKTLNIYTVGFLVGSGAGLLGYATAPSDYSLNPMNDGVVIKWTSLPGGADPTYNRGYTTVHEVGHWLGLYHPFRGGCEGDGDMVSDTPASQTKTTGCPIGQDSCPGLPGLDAVHNFMDYSADACMDNFTPGQYTRIREQATMLRNMGLV